jgi:hypothetical protein
MTLGLAVLFIAFGLPAARSAPSDMPIGIAAPEAVASRIDGQLEQNAPGGFAVTTYRDEAALRAAIRDREVYGGIAATRDGSTLLLASGGSPMVAQLLTQIGNGIAQQTGAPLHTVDLAPLPPDDPRSTGLAASALPLTLAGLLPVNFWGVTAGLTLGALATGLAVLGPGSLFDRTGLGIGTAVAMLLGNPLSGLASAPEMLPRGWGTLGQLLPQGANGTLLRSTAYFSGAGATTAIAVLTCWAVAGAALIILAGHQGCPRNYTRAAWDSTIATR